MSNEAEKLADSMDDEIAQAGRVSNHNGMLAAALLRGQAEQIRELRDALELVVNVCGFKRGESPTFDCAFAALSNTKEES